MSAGDVSSLQTSEKGWVRAQGGNRFWIPCPATLPEGQDRGSWARTMAEAWWEQSGLIYTPVAIEKIAAMFGRIHEQGYARVPCHQIWIYLSELEVPPLPVHIGVWKMSGARDERLRLLSGADDAASTRPPDVAGFAAGNLGAGLRVLRYRMRDGAALAMLGYAFRAERFETDVQVSTATRDLRHLGTALGDIDELVRSITVYTPGVPE